MPSRTAATKSADLRACASVTAPPPLCVTLPFGSIKLVLLLPREVFRQSALSLLGLQQNEVAQHETVHLCTHEAGVSLRGRADYRLAPDVERRVDEHGAACQTLEGREQVVVGGVVLAPHRLH